MPLFDGRSVVSTQLEATILRADGTIEPLGVVGYWHANPLKRALWRLKRALGKAVRHR